jgi:hypothetical protein
LPELVLISRKQSIAGFCGQYPQHRDMQKMPLALENPAKNALSDV